MEMNPQDDDKPATQGMLKELATQGMVRSLSDEMHHSFLATHEMINRLAIGVTQFTGRFEKLLEALREEVRAGFREQKGQIDSFLTKLEGYERETLNFPKMADENQKRLDNHEDRLTEHERRIAGLEPKFP